MKIITLMEDTAGNNNCLYEHGLSFYVETEKHKLLVDSGATDRFLQNAELLDVDLKQADTMILSHGHYDHGGGILAFAAYNPQAKIYMQASAGGDYYSFTGSREKYIGINKEISSLPQCIFVSGNIKIDDELSLFSHVTGTKYPIKGNRYLKRKVNGFLVQDTFDHEQCLVITQGDKHILMSGCAHSGIINILDTYMELFHGYPDIVISGFHMMQREAYSDEEISNIKKIASELLETNAVFYTGHCTSEPAYNIIKASMGEKLQPIHSGERLI